MMRKINHAGDPRTWELVKGLTAEAFCSGAMTQVVTSDRSRSMPGHLTTGGRPASSTVSAIPSWQPTSSRG